MKKNKIYSAIIVLLIGFTLNHANASSIYNPVVSIMLTSGVIDKDTLNHNIQVYTHILNTIEKNAQYKSVSLKEVKNLQARVEAQLGTLGTSLIYTVTPELNEAFQQTRIAILNGDTKKVISLTKTAKKELAEIKQLAL